MRGGRRGARRGELSVTCTPTSASLKLLTKKSPALSEIELT